MNILPVVAFRFNLDQVTWFWSSPRAAELFWTAFTIAIIAAGVALWQRGRHHARVEHVHHH